MDPIKLTIQYTAEDLQASFMLYYIHYYPVRSRLLLILGAVIFVVSILLLLISSEGFADMPLYRYLGWFFILYAVVIIAIYLWRMKTLGKRLFKKMQDFKSPYSFTFTEKGIVTKGVSISSDVEWSYYIDAVITPDLILLLPNKLRFNLFPKRHFSEEEFRQLTDWARHVTERNAG